MRADHPAVIRARAHASRTAQRRMAARAIARVACPRCGAAIGEPCPASTIHVCVDRISRENELQQRECEEAKRAKDSER